MSSKSKKFTPPLYIYKIFNEGCKILCTKKEIFINNRFVGKPNKFDNLQ